jgi:ATP-dependent helicase HrpB
MVRQVQQSVRPELRIVVMSATLAAEPIAAYLGDCPRVESQGRSFPVEIEHQMTLDRRPLAESVAEGIERALDRTAGDCLVFLPGVGEIRQCEKRLVPLAEEQRLAVLPLYGDLPAEQQDAVLRPADRRKVILATNVAETSLTIEGVTSVVDSGLARVLRFDERTGLDRLELSPISKASAEQRAGRAGRTQAGCCLRLWPEAAHRIRPDFELPEIQRVDLAGAVLTVLSWVEPDLATFPWFEQPSSPAVERALSLLELLGAASGTSVPLVQNEGTTETVVLPLVSTLGRQIAGLPVHPRIGRLLIEGQRLGISDQAALAAALLSERDPFERDQRPPYARQATVRSRSDVLDRVHALQAFESDGRLTSEVGTLHRGGARQVLKSRDQLLRLAGAGVPLLARPAVSAGRQAPRSPTTQDDEPLLRAILAAYPDRLTRRREPGSRRGLMIGGRGVRLAEQVALGDEELYVSIDVDAAGGEALVRQASAVEQDWLPAEQLVTETIVEFDGETEKVTAKKRLSFSSLVLDQSQAALPSDAEVAAALAAAVAARLDRVFPADNSDVAGFRTRVQCLAQWMPDLKLPPLDDDAVRGLLPQLAASRRSLADLRRAPWLHALKSIFTWQQLQTIDREAPERIEVPSGSKIALTYESGRPPVLAVRIQEVFGLQETPRIAGGRVRVLMHLLAPNMRVAQVTDDLASFWANTYALVRKDLRARYPKHAWPEDPYTAIARRRPGK